MMRLLTDQTVAKKVGGSILLAVLLVDLFQLIYFPAQQIEQLERALERKTSSLARVIAYEIGASIEFEDQDTAQSGLRGLEQDPDFSYAALFKADGTLFASRGPEKTVAALPHDAADRSIEWADSSIRVVEPVLSPSGRAGTLVVGFSDASIQSEIAALRATTMGSGAVILGLGLILSVAIGRSFGRRIERIAQRMETMARGTLSQTPIDDDSRDEIGRVASSYDRLLLSLRELESHVSRVARGDLSHALDLQGDLPESFNRMISSQRQLVRQIAETALQLTSASKQFLASAQQQERGSVAQSSAVEENRRTMETLLESGRQIARTSDGVLKNAERTQQNSDLVAERMATLAAHTRRIGEALELIKDIANKSDLLALNAALEGTKAGEAGRGFSLVANQIQHLAEDVMGSVKDIQELTRTISASTQATALAIEESTKLAADTTRSARQITLIIQQQFSGTEQVTEAMNDVLQVAREAAMLSKQIVDSTKDLTHLSGRLERLVGEFALAEEHASGRWSEPPPRPAPAAMAG